MLRWGLAALCVSVFAAMVMGLYGHFSNEAQNRSGVECPKSTAIVRIQTPADVISPDPRPKVATPDVRALRQEMASDSAVAHMFSGIGALPTRVASIRESLAVEVSESASTREVRVAISCSDSNPQLASDVVNLLAQRYADGCRNKLRTEMEQVCTKAREAATRARSERTAAKASLDSFLGAYFRQAETAVKAGPALSPTGKEDSKSTVMVQNPRWEAARQELGQLQERREELLVTKTPLHPTVQRQDEKIAELKVRLAAIPQQVPQASGATPASSSSSSTPPKPPAKTLESREATQTHERLRAALDRAEENCERTAQAERVAWEVRTRLPRVELVLAQPVVGPPSGGVSAGLFWIIMAAAAAMAIGVGLAAMGLAADPPLSTLSEVQEALPVPIACVFDSGALPDERIVKQSVPRSRFPWIASGAMFIVGAIVITIAVW
jgi:hypothetical protein